MFSVGIIYSTRDFLNFLTQSELAVEEFRSTFDKFKYSNPKSILELSFKCGWTIIDECGVLKLTVKGETIGKCSYSEALLIQLEDMISNYHPTWASLLPKGREESKPFLPYDVYQCFEEAGLFGPLTPELIRFWDNLALAYRNFNEKKMLELGRIGEELSLKYEFDRTGTPAIWQSIESNLSGFDILSVIEKNQKTKLQIEVKATTSNLEYASFFVSKNEWETANTADEYLFHLWLIKDKPELHIVDRVTMEKHIPKDSGDGDWRSVKIPFISVI